MPALVGKGQTLLALKRDAEAVASFEAALAADDSLADVRRRVEVLRFRTAEQVIEAARSAASSGRLDQARTAYERAVQFSPDSAFLYRELAGVERRQGNAERAVEHYGRAIDLDPSDTAALVAMADVLAERQDYQGADAAYRKAAAIEPTPELTAKIAALAERVRESRFPAEFKGDCRRAAGDTRRPGGVNRPPPRAPVGGCAAAAGRDHRHCRALGRQLHHAGRARRRHGPVREPHVPAAARHAPGRRGHRGAPARRAGRAGAIRRCASVSRSSRRLRTWRPRISSIRLRRTPWPRA